MVDDPLTVLRRISAELFERSSRIQRYLDQVGPGDSGEYAQLANTIRAALAGIERSVIEAFDTVRQLSLFSSASGLRAVYDSLARFSRWFTRAHELLNYLPRQPVAPETFAILARSFRGHYAKQTPSVMLGSLFNAFEFDFIDILESRIPDLHDIIVDRPKNIVLQLAICDGSSPLAWSILAHELGHAIDADTGVSQRAMSRFSKASPDLREMIANWSAEVSADLIATYVLGPAPLLALVNMSYCLLPLRPSDSLSETHPPILWRLQLVSDFLPDVALPASIQNEFAGYATAVDHLSQLLNGASRVPAEKQRPASILEHIIKPIAQAVAKEIASLNLEPFRPDAESLLRCKNRLDRGLPIGAQGLPRAELREAIAAFDAAPYQTAEERRLAFVNLLPRFRERPLDSGAILTSAFMRRIELVEVLCRRPHDDGAAATGLCAPLQRLDELVSSSIRSSSIHDYLTGQPGTETARPA